MTPDLWWLGGVFMIIANVFYGTAFLLYEAWLPLLAENHWDVRSMVRAQLRPCFLWGGCLFWGFLVKPSFRAYFSAPCHRSRAV